jgi:hypothetical protein
MSDYNCCNYASYWDTQIPIPKSEENIDYFQVPSLDNSQSNFGWAALAAHDWNITESPDLIGTASSPDRTLNYRSGPVERTAGFATVVVEDATVVELRDR